MHVALPGGIPGDEADGAEGGIPDGVHVDGDESAVGVLVGDGVHGVGVAGELAVAGADGDQLVAYMLQYSAVILTPFDTLT